VGGQEQNLFMKFFSKPYVGIAGTAASIIGVLLAVYLYVASRETRELVYLVNPAKSIIVASGQSSVLSVRVRDTGQEIVGDVTAAQVAFWNEGHQSIRPHNMLRPLVIKVGDGAAVLEARIVKMSRDVIGLALDTTRAADGTIVVMWEILEHNDGGVIQLVFAGDANIPIAATGIIEGQGEVGALTVSDRTTKDATASRGWANKIFFAFMSLGAGLAMLIIQILAYHAIRKEGRPFSWRILIRLLLSILLLTFFVTVALRVLLETTPGPPFGF